MNVSLFVILPVFNRATRGLIATVEKKEVLEYRTMHSSYQITACLDKEQSESDDSFCVAFVTHCLQREEGMSPLHMKRPYTVFEEFLLGTVLWNSLFVVALEDSEEKRVMMFDL